MVDGLRATVKLLCRAEQRRSQSTNDWSVIVKWLIWFHSPCHVLSGQVATSLDRATMPSGAHMVGARGELNTVFFVTNGRHSAKLKKAFWLGGSGSSPGPVVVDFPSKIFLTAEQITLRFGRVGQRGSYNPTISGYWAGKLSALCKSPLVAAKPVGSVGGGGQSRRGCRSAAKRNGGGALNLPVVSLINGARAGPGNASSALGMLECNAPTKRCCANPSCRTML